MKVLNWVKKMDHKGKKNWEDLILPVGMLSFLLVLAVTFLLRFTNKTSLVGVSITDYPADTSFGALYEGTLQKNWESWFRDNFYGHTLAVKLRNQFAYTFFSDGNGECDYGRDGFYFNNALLYAGVGGNSANPVSQEEYESYAKKVYELQTKLQKRGKTFLYLLVPHKLEIYPEYLPWNCRILWKKYAWQSNSAIVSMDRAFEKYGVNYYDATEDLLWIKENKEYDAYSPTGHHWTAAATTDVWNKIFDRIESLLPSVSCPEIRILDLTDKLDRGDQDIYRNMNILKGRLAEHYTTPVLEYIDRSPKTLYMMGTSFTWELMKAVSKNTEFRPFQKVIRQGYFSSVSTADSNGVITVDYRRSNKTADFNILANLRDSDIIILEQVKEMGILAQSERFVDYANQYFDQIYYHPGDNVLLYTEDLPAFSGFYDLQDNERWTDGNTGTIRIYGDALQGIDGELKLSVNVRSYHYDRDVKVLFNGEMIGSLEVKQEWEEYHMAIPKGLVQSDENVVCFEFTGETYSPKNLGESSDTRNLGLGFRNLSLMGDIQ